MNTPLTYYGGKQKMARDIVERIPNHQTWVDVFGGGAAVTLAKYPSYIEVLNDIGFVVSFWRCLRDEKKGGELARRLANTPWSRKELYECASSWNEEEDDDVEKARKWFTLINQGFTHEESCDSWLIAKGTNAASAWCNKVDSLPAVAQRLRRVVLECYSFEKLIPLWDSPKTLFYCDPPYISESRRSGGGGYENEMNAEQHEMLLSMLNEVKAQVMVSGYSSPLYDTYLKDWRLHKVTRKSHIHNSSKADFGTRTECLWIKENHNGSLWYPVSKGTHIDVS